MTDKAPERIWAQDADPDECDFIGGGWWDDDVGSIQHPHTVEYVRADLAPAVKQDWQPIETAPKDGTRFLGLTVFGVEMVKWHEWDGASEYSPRSGWIGLEQDSTCLPIGHNRPKPHHQPTHWMPLPNPPEGDK